MTEPEAPGAGITRIKAPPRQRYSPQDGPAIAETDSMQANPADQLSTCRTTGALDEETPDVLEHLEELSRVLIFAQDDPEALRQAEQMCSVIRIAALEGGLQGVSDLVSQAGEMLNLLPRGGPRTNYLWSRVRGSVGDAIRLAEFGPDTVPIKEAIVGARQKTLLVVDDDEVFLRIMRQLARRHSVPIVTATSVQEALTAVRGLELSAVILDVHLVDGTSFRHASEIRTSVGKDNLTIIFASGDGALQSRLAACAAGADRYLDKPISAQKFGEMVHQVPFSEPSASRIVILDDDEIVLERYESELRGAGHYVVGISESSKLLETLTETKPDALLLDVNLEAGLSGIDVCRAIRTSEQWQFLPILMFSSDKDPDMRVRAFNAGASDVLAKPLAADELITRVSAQAERVKLMRERSDTDVLSGLMTRRAFVESIQRSLALGSRENKPLCLILFDLDNFKQINDTYGHLVGDRVIATFGRLLRERFRLEDLRGRWGGEEFVLAFPGQDSRFGVMAARRLLTEFQKVNIETDSDGMLQATFTAGVASVPGDGESLDLLMKTADQRLYRGKKAGRACVVGPV